jgi:ADP-heptose:LPS heptosyltransferase
LHPWNRFEQYFKHNQLRLLEKWLGLPEISPQQFNPERIKNILVVRQHDQLGDFLLSTPVFKSLREHFPGRSISLVARKYTAVLAQQNPYIDHVVTFYEHGGDWTRQGILDLSRALWNKYDLVIVLNTVSHSLTSDLIARLCCKTLILGSSHLVFGGTNRNFFYSLAAPYDDHDRHQSERNLDILAYIGVMGKDKREQIFLTTGEKERARRHLIAQGWDTNRTLVMIHPGAGKINNRWPVLSFAAVANRLLQTLSVQVAVSWGPSEQDLGRELIAAIDAPVITAVDDDLRKLAALFSQAGLFICNDTGVMHMAAAVATPLVAVFGPTDPLFWKPWGDLFVSVRSDDQKCASVSSDQVFDMSFKILKNN